MDNKSAIQAEQTRQLFSAIMPSLVIGIFLAATLAYMQWDVIDHEVVIAWLSLLELIQLARIALVVAYRRSPDDVTSHVWRARFRLGVLAAAVVWGSAAFLLYPEAQQQHQMFVIFMLSGLTASGVVSYSADLLSSMMFSLGVTSPLILRLLAGGDAMSTAMAVAGLLYLAFIIVSLRQINRNLIENIRMRFEADAREEALEENREKFRVLSEAAFESIFISEKGICLEQNLRAQEMFGYTPEEAVGRSGTEWIVPKDRELVQKNMMSGYEQPYEVTGLRKDGSTFTAAIRGRMMHYKGRNVRVTSIRDISEQKQAEAELRIAASAFEAQEGMLITDARGLILRVNKAFTNITGYTSQEAVGQTPRLLNSRRHDEAFYKTMWASINWAGSWEGEIWNRRKNGEIYPEYLIITAVKDADGIISNYVATFNDITASKAAAEEIQHLAFYDPLTQLPNRRLLVDRLQQALASSVRNGRKGALLFIDLDNFKTLNDTLGHDMGDLLLQQVAQRLVSCVREGDTVARLGGDEFVVMLEDLSEQELEAAAQTKAAGEKILSVLNQPHMLANHEYRSTPSIGVTLFKEYPVSIDELFKQADIAMYQAKKGGRNTLRFFDPQMQDTINVRAALEKELSKAIENRQLQLHYQIQVDSAHRVIGVEALLRWTHPERGIIPPSVFIPLAEETGLILPIGEWVLHTACAQIKTWSINPATRHLRIAVNVSSVQFAQDDFVAQVKRALDESGSDPACLKLELTESLMLNNVDDIISKMHQIKAFGVGFSMDDFGTGFSSLSYLKKLPLDQLKIDQSFVRDLVSDHNDKAIVEAIITMAEAFGLNIIAEGVETEEQRAHLSYNGCNTFQGFLFSKPLPIEQVDLMLVQRLH